MKRSGRKRDRGSFDESGPEAETAPTGVIYGVLPVAEALGAGRRRIEKILVAEGKQHARVREILNLAGRHNVPVRKIPRQALERYVESGANHQGVVALAAPAGYADADELFADIVSQADAFCLILDGVEDPHNLGAILRSAECAGVEGVFIPERRAAGLTETVVKSSAGATEHVRLARVTNINRLIDDLKERNIWVVGASGDAGTDYTEWDWKQPTALVLGSEGRGLSRLTAEKCDVLVRIPLAGRIGSLNVSVAAGVILFEAVRQRRRNK